MNMIACCLSGHNLQFVFRRNLPEEVTHTKSDLTGQDRLAILRHPDQTDFQVALRVRAKSIMPHATTLHQPCFAGRRGVSTIPDADTKPFRISRWLASRRESRLSGIQFGTKRFLSSGGRYGLVATLSWSKVISQLVEGRTESLGG